MRRASNDDRPGPSSFEALRSKEAERATRARGRQDVVEIPDLAGRRTGHQGGRHGTGRLV